MSDRTTRDNSTRDKLARAVYVPPSLLPEPAPDPDYVFRWVMTAVLGQPDPTNTSRRFREGWEPVKAEDHPELGLPGNAAGNVEIGGLILCKMAKEMATARDAYYRSQAKDQMEAVDNTFMKNNDPRMPLFQERKSGFTRGFGNGSK